MELIIKEIAALIDDAESSKASTIREAEIIQIERKAYENIKELVKELDYGSRMDMSIQKNPR